MTAYYNENDPKAAQWLRELIKAGLIVAGEVDERSITDVEPGDLTGFIQCHFFAGIGGWSYALRLAGWPDDRPVWTGSCPCQPFSSAGRRLGEEDDRHLWPEFARLIEKCNPSAVFGEQVASKAGREWLAGIRSDMEGMGYGIGAGDLCAAGVGAPHIRQRLYWVAYSHDPHRGAGIGTKEAGTGAEEFGGRGSGQCGENGRLGDPISPGLERHPGDVDHGGQPGRDHPIQNGPVAPASGSGFWHNAQWIPCIDGKRRRIEPGTSPLAYGVPERVGILRGYGNAIVPQVAKEVIEVFMEFTGEF